MAATTLLTLMELWLWAGAAVALLFLVWGIDRVDEDARGAYVFRPLLVPGILLIWPLVLWRWAMLEMGRENWQRRHAPPRIAHRAAAIVMGCLILLALGLASANRQVWPADAPAIQVAGPES